MRYHTLIEHSVFSAFSHHLQEAQSSHEVKLKELKDSWMQKQISAKYPRYDAACIGTLGLGSSGV